VKKEAGEFKGSDYQKNTAPGSGGRVKKSTFREKKALAKPYPIFLERESLPLGSQKEKTDVRSV